MEVVLLTQIENLRHQMISMAQKRTLSDPLIVTISQKLDTLLNEYYSMYSEERKAS